MSEKNKVLILDSRSNSHMGIYFFKCVYIWTLCKNAFCCQHPSMLSHSLSHRYSDLEIPLYLRQPNLTFSACVRVCVTQTNIPRSLCFWILISLTTVMLLEIVICARHQVAKRRTAHDKNSTAISQILHRIIRRNTCNHYEDIIGNKKLY